MKEKKYSFSFTATSLRTKEFVELAKWDDLTQTKELEIQIGNGKESTGRRMLAEFKRWIEALTSEQIEVLKNGTFKEQNQIAFLAVCKTYDFIKEFVIEVVRDKYLLFDYEITDGDYLSFFRSKSYQYEELEDLTDLTQAKIKQVIFRMLEQAGIIDTVRSRMIQPQIVEESVLRAILSENKEFLKFFLFSEMDINKLSEVYG